MGAYVYGCVYTILFVLLGKLLWRHSGAPVDLKTGGFVVVCWLD